MRLTLVVGRVLSLTCFLGVTTSAVRSLLIIS